MTVRQRPRKPRSGRVVAIGIVGVSVMAAVASVVARRASAPTRNAELQRVIAEKAAQVAATNPMIHVEIRTDPATAALEMDGQRVANPFIRSGASEGKPHQIAAVLPGFDPVRQSVRFDHDHMMVLKLLPREGPAPAPAHPAAVDTTVIKGPGAPKVPDTHTREGTTQSGSPRAAVPGYHGSKPKIEPDFP